MEGPNVVEAGLSIVRSLVKTDRPRPQGSGGAATASYALALAEIAARGPAPSGDLVDRLDQVVADLSVCDPDGFDTAGALAFWLDLYNAGALALAARASSSGEESVLRIPGGFDSPFTSVAGESLSLDAIEHGKVRRFGDPRVHAALVCGSVSCPTLRSTPYSGTDLDAVLDDQMTWFLARGGIVPDHGRNVVLLSRVFAWFGADFVRPKKMPTLVPARRQAILTTLLPYVDTEVRQWLESDHPRIEYQQYDWGLRCTVG